MELNISSPLINPIEKLKMNLKNIYTIKVLEK